MVMNHDTYITLLRSAEKRKRRASIVGNWKAVAEACAEIVRLHSEFVKTMKPNS